MNLSKTVCPHCESDFRVKPSSAGKSTHCNNCGHGFIVQLVDSAEDLIIDLGEDDNLARVHEPLEDRFPVLRGYAFVQYVFAGLAILIGLGFLLSGIGDGNPGPAISVFAVCIISGFGFLLTKEVIHVILAIEENTRISRK